MPREAYISSFVLPYGTSMGIGSATASALDAVGVRGPVSVAQRLVRKSTRRLRDRLLGHRRMSSSGSRDQYMRRAVREIVEITRSHNLGVPLYGSGTPTLPAAATLTTVQPISIQGHGRISFLRKEVPIPNAGSPS
jgi:hypothetical protein